MGRVSVAVGGESGRAYGCTSRKSPSIVPIQISHPSWSFVTYSYANPCHRTPRRRIVAKATLSSPQHRTRRFSVTYTIGEPSVPALHDRVSAVDRPKRVSGRLLDGFLVEPSNSVRNRFLREVVSIGHIWPPTIPCCTQSRAGIALSRLSRLRHRVYRRSELGSPSVPSVILTVVMCKDFGNFGK